MKIFFLSLFFLSSSFNNLSVLGDQLEANFLAPKSEQSQLSEQLILLKKFYEICIQIGKRNRNYVFDLCNLKVDKFFGEDEVGLQHFFNNHSAGMTGDILSIEDSINIGNFEVQKYFNRIPYAFCAWYLSFLLYKSLIVDENELPQIISKYESIKSFSIKQEPRLNKNYLDFLIQRRIKPEFSKDLELIKTVMNEEMDKLFLEAIILFLKLFPETETYFNLSISPNTSA